MDLRQDPFDNQMSLSDIQSVKDDTQPAVKQRVSAKKTAPVDDEPVVVTGNTTLTGQPADKVVINPTIDPFLMEEKDEPIVSPKNGKHAFIVGGFSPFTRAHHELVKHAQRNFEHVHVFTTQSTSRPIPVEDKIKYIKAAVGPNVTVSSTKTPLHAASEVYKRGAKQATFVGGSDRKAIVDRVNQYNDKPGAHGEYHFEKPVELEVFGKERTEGGSGLAGISGTKARAAESPEELKKFIPKALHPHAAKIFNQIHEELEYFEEAASLRTRLGRARNMKMNKNKLNRARTLARKRLAKTLQLRRRALKRARQNMRQRLAGERGKNYKSLSTSDKIAIDKMADKRKKQILRMATRLAPRIKRDEIARLASIASGKKVANSATPMIAEQMNVKQLISEKAAVALATKANNSGISLKVLCEVYARGIAEMKDTNHTPQQQGFARVNSYLAKGAAWIKDSDLHEQDRERIQQIGIKTPRQMEKFKFKNLKQTHSDQQTKDIQKDIADDENQVARRKVADIIRRRTNQLKDKILESMVSTNRRLATRAAHQGKAAESSLRSNIAKAAASGDATGVMHANMELKAKKELLGKITTIRPKTSYGRGTVKTTYTSNVARHRVDLSRKRRFNSALSEAVSSAIIKTSNRLTRSTAPQVSQVKKELVKAMKSKDYSTMADIIVYLTRDKLNQQKRIQQESTEYKIGSQSMTNDWVKKADTEKLKGMHDQMSAQNNLDRNQYQTHAAIKAELKKRNALLENVCVPEEDYIYQEWTEEQWNALTEENNEGRALNKPFRTPGGPKKFAVYVKNDKGNVIKLGFGDPNLEIKRDDPERRKAYRARHGCDNPGPRWKANWWSCNWSWSASKKVGA